MQLLILCSGACANKHGIPITHERLYKRVSYSYQVVVGCRPASEFRSSIGHSPTLLFLSSSLTNIHFDFSLKFLVQNVF